MQPIKQLSTAARTGSGWPRHPGAPVPLPGRCHHKLASIAASTQKDGKTSILAQQDASALAGQGSSSNSSSAMVKEPSLKVSQMLSSVTDEVVAILSLAARGVRMQAQVLKGDIKARRRSLAGAVDEMVLAFTADLEAMRKALSEAMGPEATQQLLKAVADARNLGDICKRQAGTGQEPDALIDELAEQLTATADALQRQLQAAEQEAASSAAGASTARRSTVAVSDSFKLVPAGSLVQPPASSGKPSNGSSAAADSVAEAFGILDDAVSGLAGLAAELKQQVAAGQRNARTALEELVAGFAQRTQPLKSPHLAASGSSFLADDVEITTERLGARASRLAGDRSGGAISTNAAIDELMEDIRFAASDLRRAVLARRPPARRIRGVTSSGSMDSVGSMDEERGALATGGVAAMKPDLGAAFGAAGARTSFRPAGGQQPAASSSSSATAPGVPASTALGPSLEDQVWAAAGKDLEERTWALASLATLKTGRSSKSGGARKPKLPARPGSKPSAGAEAMADVLRTVLPIFGVRVKARKVKTAGGKDSEDLKREALALADDALAAFRAKADAVARAMSGADADTVRSALAAFDGRVAAIKAAVAADKEGAVAQLDALVGSLSASLQDLDLLLAQELEAANQSISSAMTKLADTTKPPAKKASTPPAAMANSSANSSGRTGSTIIVQDTSTSAASAAVDQARLQQPAPSASPVDSTTTEAAPTVEIIITEQVAESSTAAAVQLTEAVQVEVVVAGATETNSEEARAEVLELANSSIAAVQGVLAEAQAAAVAATGQPDAGTAAAAGLLEDLAQQLETAPVAVLASEAGGVGGAQLEAAAGAAAANPEVVPARVPSPTEQVQQGSAWALQVAVGLAGMFALNQAVAVGLVAADLTLPAALANTMPVPLAAMLAVAGGLAVLGQERAQPIVDFFAPSTAFVTKWLPLFCVPVLVSLPQALQGMPAEELARLAGVLAVGVAATLAATAKSIGAAAAGSTQQQARAQAGALKPALLWGAVAAAALSLTAVVPSYGLLMTLPAGLGCTVCGYLLASALPAGLQLLLHPTVFAAAAAVAGAALHGSLMGVGYQGGLDVYMGAATFAPSTVLLSLLSVAITHISFLIHSSRKAVSAAGGLAAIIGASVLSAVFSLGCTLAAAVVLKMPQAWALALLPRCLTAPAALSVATSLGAPASCSTTAALLQSLLAIGLGRAVLALVGARGAAQRGLAAGAVAGVAGTAALAGGDSDALPFAGLSCAVVGLTTALILAVPAVRTAVLSLITAA